MFRRSRRRGGMRRRLNGRRGGGRPLDGAWAWRLASELRPLLPVGETVVQLVSELRVD